MKKLFSFCLMVSVLLVIASSVTVAQTNLGVVGKKFTRNDANVLFGKVTASIQVSKAEIESAVARAKEYVYFTIKNNRVVVLSDRRMPLNETSFTWEKGTVAYLLSKSVVEDFINNTKSRILTFELRSSAPVSVINKSGLLSTTSDGSSSTVFTISGDEETLEMSLPCPPMCE
jgi:hypothetical protein